MARTNFTRWMICMALTAGCGGHGSVVADSGVDVAVVPDAPEAPDAPDAAPPPTFTIDNTAPGEASPTSGLGVGTNQIYSVVLLSSPAPSAADRLHALAPSLMRLHIHGVGGNLPTAAAVTSICSTPSDTSCNRTPWSFTNLDYLVADARAAGAEPLMSISMPPPWQWTVTDATSQPKPTGHVTDADDPTAPFAMFASYMRSLVEYYNLGQTTVTEADGTTHTIVNPRGTANRITWWELLNEPAITSPANPYQPPGPYPLTPVISAAAYIRMWNATTATMLQADPTVKLVGPALPFARTTADPTRDYIPLVLAQSRKPDAISFHGYAWADNETPDLVAYTGDPTNRARRGLADILADVHQVQAWTQAAGVPALPIWLDEFGFNGFGVTDPHGRPNHAFGAAFAATAFQLFAAEPAVAQLDEFSFALQAYPDLSLLDLTADHQPTLLYWLYRALGQAFPSGRAVLAVHAPAPVAPLVTPGVSVYAVRDPSSGAVSVLLANATVASASDVGGSGVATRVAVAVAGGAFTGVSAVAIDASTDLSAGPAELALPAGNTATVDLPGYGVAVVRFTP